MSHADGHVDAGSIDTGLWRDMMGYLRQKHPSICRQWFDDLTPMELNAGLLKIHTGNNVHERYLQQKCADQFREAAQAVTGALVSVRFTSTWRPPPPEARASGVRPSEPVVFEHPGLMGGSTNGDSAPGQTNTQTPRFAPQSYGSNNPSSSVSPSTSTPTAIPGAGFSGATVYNDDDDDVPILSPDYTFETFVAGPNNDLAAAAATAVADQPGMAYNPLFVHGGVGLGKTHLLQAICQGILNRQPDFRIVYVSCERFMNQFIEAVTAGQMSQFRHRYRDADMLVIDDIHFLADKERTQEEFFHTFNELFQTNRQIVISSDAAPSEIPRLEDRLVSRFQWGLVAQVTRPSFETRMAILKSKSRLRGLELDDEVLSHIAERVDSHARELEGKLNALQMHATLLNRPIDLAMAKQVTGDTSERRRSNHVALQDIIGVVTDYYQVKVQDLQSRKRHKSITEPRQICMWLARQYTRFSLEEIGGHFGGRDHTTVMHSIKTVDDRCETDPRFADQISQLQEEINNLIAPGSAS